MRIRVHFHLAEPSASSQSSSFCDSHKLKRQISLYVSVIWSLLYSKHDFISITHERLDDTLDVYDHNLCQDSADQLCPWGTCLWTMNQIFPYRNSWIFSLDDFATSHFPLLCNFVYCKCERMMTPISTERKSSANKCILFPPVSTSMLYLPLGRINAKTSHVSACKTKTALSHVQ